MCHQVQIDYPKCEFNGTCRGLSGFSRLAYPFLIGLVINMVARMQIHISRHGFVWCSIILAVILVMPRVGGANPDNFWMNGLYEIFAILLVFPLVIMMGRGSTVVMAR